MPNQTEEKVKDILSQSLGVNKSELVSNASFEADLNVAQADLVNVIARIFEEFEMEADPSDEGQFRTVGELIVFVKDCLDEIEE